MNDTMGGLFIVASALLIPMIVVAQLVMWVTR